jgi:hypothetical protein
MCVCVCDEDQRRRSAAHYDCIIETKKKKNCLKITKKCEEKALLPAKERKKTSWDLTFSTDCAVIKTIYTTGK